MKPTTARAALASAAVLLAAPGCLASHAHRHLHEHLFQRTHDQLHVHRTEEPAPIQRRGGTCALPDDPTIVPVTPDESNGGWAMSPDQKCTSGTYCPYACKPGMVMAQWEPGSTYVYPASMHGGLLCGDDGQASKPFPSKPYCVEGTGAVVAVNQCGSSMSWCQTVLPGNEAMLIATLVESEATIAVPDTSYWCETAAHYYVNPPGSGTGQCAWGEGSGAWGNWSPYVAGANTDANGLTYVKIGYNPVWQSSGLKSTSPSYALEVQCPDTDCVGLPCKIDPSQDGAVDSAEAATGAGGAGFCVVTVPSGGKANIVAYNAGSSPGSVSGDADSSSSSESTSAAPVPTTSSKPPPPPSTTSTSTTPTSTSVPPTTTSTTPSSTSTSKSSSSSASTPDEFGGIFHENSNSTDHTETTKTHGKTSATKPAAVTSTTTAAPTTKDKKGEAGRKQGSAALSGLVVAFIAAACFF